MGGHESPAHIREDHSKKICQKETPLPVVKKTGACANRDKKSYQSSLMTGALAPNAEDVECRSWGTSQRGRFEIRWPETFRKSGEGLMSPKRCQGKERCIVSKWVSIRGFKTSGRPNRDALLVRRARRESCLFLRDVIYGVDVSGTYHYLQRHLIRLKVMHPGSYRNISGPRSQDSKRSLQA